MKYHFKFSAGIIIDCLLPNFADHIHLNRCVEYSRLREPAQPTKMDGSQRNLAAYCFDD